MDTERLQALAGINKPQHGNMDLFQDSLRIMFGLDPETIEAVIGLIRRHGDTIKLRDQQVRRRAGTRAIQMLQQAHTAASSEGDEHYDEEDPETADPEAEMDDIDPGVNTGDDVEADIDLQQNKRPEKGEMDWKLR